MSNKISNIDTHNLVWLYLVPPFQEWLASTNAANFITTNVNEKRTVDQIEKKPTPSERSDGVHTTKSRMKWNYGQRSECAISNNIWSKLKLQADQQGPTKIIIEVKLSLEH